MLLIVSTGFLHATSKVEIIHKALEKRLYEKEEWQALLSYDDHFEINNRSFLFRGRSPKEELIATINAFYTPKERFTDLDRHPQCRFPARLLFIIHELDIPKKAFPSIECKGFKDYLKKAPAETISLVYASEKVNNPSSMMGHSFIKIEGKNYRGIHVEHAVSFYTIIDTFNLLKLGWQNIVTGMKGLYALQPYKEVMKIYTEKEDRNVWEYRLKLDDYRKKLIYFHLWELKDVRMKYYFTSYNCSTVIYNLLLLAQPQISHERTAWITPLEIVKILYRYNLVSKATLRASKEWLVKMYESQNSFKTVKTVKEIVSEQKYGKIKNLDIYGLKLLEAYIDLEFSKGKISKTKYITIRELITTNKRYEQTTIDLSHYKLPYKSPPERQFGLGYASVDDTSYAKLYFLGASHFLNDDNIEYFTESELKIVYLSLLLRTDDIELEEFTLYGMKSYIPYDILTNDLSYQFEMSVKKDFTKNLSLQDTLKIDCGFGIDFKIFEDINLFALLNGGYGYNRIDRSHLFFDPNIGFTIYEIFNMKSLFLYEPKFSSNGFSYDKILFEQNLFLQKRYKLFFHYEKYFAAKKKTMFSFGLTLLF